VLVIACALVMKKKYWWAGRSVVVYSYGFMYDGNVQKLIGLDLPRRLLPCLLSLYYSDARLFSRRWLRDVVPKNVSTKGATIEYGGRTVLVPSLLISCMKCYV
jgi:hypothetical protein